MKKIIALVILFYISFLTPPVLGFKEYLTKIQLEQLGFSGYESSNPGDFLYPVYKIIDSLRYKLASPSEKSKLEVEGLDKRFNELTYIANYEKNGFLTESVNRYNARIGQIKADGKEGNIKENAKKYLLILEKLRDRYPANSAYWLQIQQAVDVTRSVL